MRRAVAGSLELPLLWQVRVRRAGAADRGLSVPALNLKVNSARSARYGFTVCEPSTDYTPTDPGPRTRIRRRSTKTCRISHCMQTGGNKDGPVCLDSMYKDTVHRCAAPPPGHPPSTGGGNGESQGSLPLPAAARPRAVRSRSTRWAAVYGSITTARVAATRVVTSARVEGVAVCR